MSDSYECKYECKHCSHCSHSEENYCDINDMPIFMAHNEFFDVETGECSKKEQKIIPNFSVNDLTVRVL